MGSSVNQNSTSVKIDSNNYATSSGKIIQKQDKSVNANKTNINSEEIETELLDLSNTIEKTTDDLAYEVWHGDWGVGEERKKRLTEAGYDPFIIQERVNQLIWGITDAEYNNDPRLKIEEEKIIEPVEEAEVSLNEEEQWAQLLESLGINTENIEELKSSFTKTIDDLENEQEELKNYLKVDKNLLKDVKEKYPALKFDGYKILPAEEAISYEGYSDEKMAAAAAVAAVNGYNYTIEDYNSQLSAFLLENYNITFEDYQEYLKALNSDIEILKASYYQLEQQAKLKPYDEIRDTSEYKDYISSIQNLDEEYEKVFRINEMNIHALGAYDEVQAQFKTDYAFMTDEEKEMMLYLHHKGVGWPGDECRDYRCALEDSLNQRKGINDAQAALDSIRNEDGTIDEKKAYKLIDDGFVDGVDNFFDSINAVFREDAIITDTQYKQMILLEELKDYNKTTTVYNVSNMVGNMTPVLLISVLNPTAGKVALGLSAAGSSKNYALQYGNSLTKATVYGTLNGLTTVGLMSLGGNMPGLSTTSSASLSGVFMAGVTGSAITYADAGLKALVLGETINIEELNDDAKEEFITYALTSFAMNKVANTAKRIKCTFKNGKYMEFDESLTPLDYFKENPKQLSELKSFELLTDGSGKATPSANSRGNTNQAGSPAEIIKNYNESQKVPFSEKGTNRVSVEEMSKGSKAGSPAEILYGNKNASSNVFDNMGKNYDTPQKTSTGPKDGSPAEILYGNKNASSNVFDNMGKNYDTPQKTSTGPKDGSPAEILYGNKNASSNAFDNMGKNYDTPQKTSTGPKDGSPAEILYGNKNASSNVFDNMGKNYDTPQKTSTGPKDGSPAEILYGNKNASSNAFDNMGKNYDTPQKTSTGPKDGSPAEILYGNKNASSNAFDNMGKNYDTPQKTSTGPKDGSPAEILYGNKNASSNAFDNMGKNYDTPQKTSTGPRDGSVIIDKTTQTNVSLKTPDNMKQPTSKPAEISSKNYDNNKSPVEIQKIKLSSVSEKVQFEDWLNENIPFADKLTPEEVSKIKTNYNDVVKLQKIETDTLKLSFKNNGIDYTNDFEKASQRRVNSQKTLDESCKELYYKYISNN